MERHSTYSSPNKCPSLTVDTEKAVEHTSSSRGGRSEPGVWGLHVWRKAASVQPKLCFPPLLCDLPVCYKGFRRGSKCSVERPSSWLFQHTWYLKTECCRLLEAIETLYCNKWLPNFLIVHTILYYSKWQTFIIFLLFSPLKLILEWTVTLDDLLRFRTV